MSTVATEVGSVADRVASSQRAKYPLGSRTLDFWMLGGFSILLWFSLYLFLKWSALLNLLGAVLPAIAVALA